VAAAGPLLVGVLHATPGGCAVPVVGLLAVLAGELATGWQAGRAITLPEASG
jgi:cyanate permease